MTEKHPLVTDELIAKLDARAEREKAIRQSTAGLTLSELQAVTPAQIRALPKLIKILDEVAFEMDRGYIFQGTRASDRAADKLLEKVQKTLKKAGK